jgi:hypothetical protein
VAFVIIPTGRTPPRSRLMDDADLITYRLVLHRLVTHG